MVSNRPYKDKIKMKGNDACCDDIYSVYIRELVIDLLVTVMDDKGPLNGAVVELADLTLGSYPESKSNLNTNIFNFPLIGDRTYKGIVKKEGYFPDTISFNTNGIIDDYTVKKTVKLKVDPNYKKEPETEIISINQPIRLNNILYGYDKWDITTAAEKDLSYLLELMEDYPDMEIELSSHTDFRGDDKYNQTLSQKRAQSATNWLIERGIDKKRIKSVGYGEKRPLINCKKCTEDEHQLNRRTEFRIIKGPDTIEIKKEIFKKG
jgi:peptidoglycan-associated lipoprotein